MCGRWEMVKLVVEGVPDLLGQRVLDRCALRKIVFELRTDDVDDDGAGPAGKLVPDGVRQARPDEGQQVEAVGQLGRDRVVAGRWTTRRRLRTGILSSSRARSSGVSRSATSRSGTLAATAGKALPSRASVSRIRAGVTRSAIRARSVAASTRM